MLRPENPLPQPINAVAQLEGRRDTHDRDDGVNTAITEICGRNSSVLVSKVWLRSGAICCVSTRKAMTCD
jgi:hypothetical protein